MTLFFPFRWNQFWLTLWGLRSLMAGEDMATWVWGIWPHWVCNQRAEKNESWCSAKFLLLFSQGSQKSVILCLVDGKENQFQPLQLSVVLCLEGSAPCDPLSPIAIVYAPFHHLISMCWCLRLSEPGLNFLTHLWSKKKKRTMF